MTDSRYDILTFHREFPAFKALMNTQPKPDPLMKLIRDSKFSFDLDLSSRMLNYHEKRRYILYERIGAAAKRRFSLVNNMGFFFSNYIRQLSVPAEKVKEINEALKADNHKEILYAWDWVVYFGVLSLGLFEIYVKLNPNKQHPTGYTIELSTKAKEGQFHLSQKLRETFFDKRGNDILTGRMAPFLPKLLIEIDMVRAPLGLELLSPEIHVEAKWRGTENMVSSVGTYIKGALNTLPLSEYTRMYDILHRDDTGTWYGIEIKELYIPRQAKLTSTKFSSTPEELLEAIERELGFLQKMKERLAREKDREM